MHQDNSKLRFVCGTAMWGWTIERTIAFALADCYYALGGRWFDTASNYPINGQPSAYGLAEHWLSEWARDRAHDDVAVIAKIGALSNDRSPAADLRSSALRRVFEQTRVRFGDRLRLISLHWDHRNDASEIADTISFLRDMRGKGMHIGLSGIQHPHLYAQLAPDLQNEWWIQIKHNFLTREAYEHYAVFHEKAKFLAYGLNGGGLKLGVRAGEGTCAQARGLRATVNLEAVERALQAMRGRKCAPRTLNEMSVVFALANADVWGILVGPSQEQHLIETFTFAEGLTRKDARALLAGVASTG